MTDTTKARELTTEQRWSAWRSSGPIWTKYGVSDPRSAEIAQEYSAHENAELRKEVDVLDGALSSKNESVIELAQTCEKLEAENSQLREREVELEAEGLRLVSELTKMWTATSCLQGLVKDLHAKIGAALEDKK